MSKKKKAAPDARACAIYARYSSNRQREESIEQQIEVCTRWAEREGLEVAAVYADKHISGTTDNRPQFQLMLKEAEQGKWATVVVYKVDRFSRESADAAIYRRKLRLLGVSVKSACEAIPDTPEGIIMQSLLDGMAEYYSANLRQNVKRGMDANAQKCMANGVKLFGYTINSKGYYEINSFEAPIVQGIYEQLAAGINKKDVLEWARSEGAVNRLGNPISYDFMRRLVQNPKYRGVYMFGDTIIEDGMPRLVSDELWHYANSNFRNMPRRFDFPLTGKMIDAECKKPYRGVGGTSCSGKRYLYYSVVDNEGIEHRYPKESVERTIADAVAKMLTKSEVAHGIAENFVQMLKEINTPDKEAIEAELQEVERKNKIWLKQLQDGVEIEGLKEKARATQELRALLKSKLMRVDTYPSVEEIAAWIAEDIAHAETEELLRAIVERIEFNRSNATLKIDIPWQIEQQPRDIQYSENSTDGRVLISRVWWAYDATKGTIFYGKYGIRLIAKLKI